MLTKFFEVLLKKVHHFSSFLRQLHQIVEGQVLDFVLCVIMVRWGQINYFFNWDFKEKHKSMLRLPQNGRSRCTESSNFSREKFSLSSTAAKTRRSMYLQVSFDYRSEI